MSQRVFQPKPDLPPPREKSGVIGWLRKNLFSSPVNIVVTILTLALIGYGLYLAIDWGIASATFTGDRSACQTVNEFGSSVDAKGACWSFVRANFIQMMFGLEYAFETGELWRPILFMAVFAGIIILFTVPKLRKPFIRIFTSYSVLVILVVFPILSYGLLEGTWFGLHQVKVAEWGGFLLTLVLSTVGMVAAFPLGMLFALGRRSKLRGVRTLSVIYIEIWRGAPLITFLFISATLLPLFLGEFELSRAVRALVIITLFQSSYTAEAIRGGLAAIPRGQYEASTALGLGWWDSNLRIILPQALTIAIPPIVSTFIEIVKDTSLVAIIGLADLFGITRRLSSQGDWLGYFLEGFVVVAFIFFIVNFALSQYSKRLERKKDKSKTIA